MYTRHLATDTFVRWRLQVSSKTLLSHAGSSHTSLTHTSNFWSCMHLHKHIHGIALARQSSRGCITRALWHCKADTTFQAIVHSICALTNGLGLCDMLDSTHTFGCTNILSYKYDSSEMHIYTYIIVTVVMYIVAFNWTCCLTVLLSIGLSAQDCKQTGLHTFSGITVAWCNSSRGNYWLTESWIHLLFIGFSHMYTTMQFSMSVAISACTSHWACTEFSRL